MDDDHVGIELGLYMGCGRDVGGDPIRGRSWFSVDASRVDLI